MPLSESLTVEIGADLSALTSGLAQAGRDLAQFANTTVGGATRSMSSAFTGTFSGLTSAIVTAARTGQATIRTMVDAILADMARLAIRRTIAAPIEGLVSSALAAAIGALTPRAAGGPVAPGTPYIVGEHGPELFVPGGAGAIATQAPARAAPQIVFNVRATDARSFAKSESQIAAMLSRALARGQRNL